MKKVLLAIMLVCLLIPSMGWGKEWVFWFNLPNCYECHGWGLQYTCGNTCKFQLFIRKSDLEPGNLKIKLIERARERPYTKTSVETDWFFQEEEIYIYKLENIFDISDLRYFQMLEVKIISKHAPKVFIILKTPFDEDFEAVDSKGNIITQTNQRLTLSPMGRNFNYY